MVAKNTAETDDQIIDLTELIEKGEVPANDPSAQTPPAGPTEMEAEQDALHEQLRGLNDGSAAADAEIDGLLAQMDMKENSADDPNDVALDFSAPSTQTDHPIDPNEQLPMPGMGDVDSLLNSLDIPPQPSEREAETAAPASADQAVDALLTDISPAAPAEQPAEATSSAPAEQSAQAPQDTAPDLDELLASANAAPSTGNLSEIDDLLSEASPAPASPEPTAPSAPSAAPAEQPPAFSSDDLDSLLAAAASGLDAAASPTQTPAPKAQPSAPAQEPAPSAAAPDQPPAPAPVATPDMGVDIDSLLAAAADDLQEKLDAAQPEATPEPQPAAPAQEPAPAPSAAAPEQSPAPAPVATPDMGVDIDSLLAAAADDLQEKLDAAQPEAAPAVQPETPPAMDADIDNLLSAATGEAPSTPEAQEEISDVLLHPELELMADTPPENQPEPISDTLPDSLTDGMPEQELQPELTSELPEDFEALLAAATDEAAATPDIQSEDVQEIASEAPAQAEPEIFEAVAEHEPAQDENIPPFEPDVSLSPEGGVLSDPFVEEPLEAASDLAEMPSSGQPTFAPADYELQPATAAEGTATATTAAVSAADLEAVMEQAREASSHAIDAFAQAFDASTRAADAADTASKLEERIETCERALQEAGDRIIALETALEAQIHASQELAAASLPRQELEDMFVEGHPLHQSLMDCIGKAVAAALSSATPQQPECDGAEALVEERLQPVATAARSATARLDSLESRLDALEPRFNDRVERAAAAAAARILREEIGRLLEE